MRRIYAFLVATLLVAGCATTQTYTAPGRRDNPTPPLPEGTVAHRVFLTGNTGDAESAAVLRAIADDARADGEDATVAILGNVTAHGLPAADADDRAQAEAPVQALIDALADLEAEVIVVPGNQDWEKGEDGVKRLEAMLDDAFGRDVLTPGDQSGGPREIKAAEGLRLVAFDTAWWLLDPDDQPEGEAEDQDVRSPSDVARIFEQILVDREDDRIVVLAHHPLISRGAYAGYRSNPFSGFVSQTLGTSSQDLSSPRYRQLRAGLGDLAATHDGLVWAASHDRILMTYSDIRSTLSQQTHLVSGTGGGKTGTSGAAGALAVASRPGYQRLVYYQNGRLWAETVEVDLETGASEVTFRVEISDINAELVDTEVPDSVDVADLPDAIGGTVRLAADEDFVTERFSNGSFTRALFGKNYRDVWKTQVEFPVLDMGTEAGGLVPVKRGGGLQTTSLRLLGGDGHEYGLRLLEKSGLAQVPFALRDGLVGDVVLELRAAMAPYGALVASPLARVVGVAQPDPKIVFVPDDPRLGRYRETFADRLALYEVRPDDDMSDVAGFEGMTDIISAAKLREEVREDQDHHVDQRAYLRARLLDILIADWDRHADQWRWAAYEPGELDASLTGDDATKGKVYRPIARDRDFSFYGIGGLLQPALQFFDRRLQPFKADYGSIQGQTQNGYFQDRRFLDELSRDDWREISQEVQATLTDADIERSVRALPDTIYAQIGDYWTSALKSRRDQLAEAADNYYELLAGTVDVVGSDERELFEAVRQPDGMLAVTVRSYKGGEAGRVLWSRTFRPSETNEVRLFGFAGRDVFRVTGDGPRTILVRVIGGAGEDELDAPTGEVIAYDTPDGLDISEDSRVSDRRSREVDVNRYDPTEQVLASRLFFPSVGYSPTDGALLGGSVTLNVPGFRLRPFAATHVIAVNYATATGGLAASYTGRMREAIGTYDLDADAAATTARYARNFYGFGNNSRSVDGDLARVNLAQVAVRAGVGVPIGEGLKLVVGPSLRYADASRDSLNGSPISLLTDDAFGAQTHGGGFARLAASTADHPANPRQGLRLEIEGSAFSGLSGPAQAYGTVGGQAVAYVPLRLVPQVTLALRAGGQHIIGDFPFFDAAVLGGPGSLRGYRRQRFAGRTATSGSVEARAKVFDFNAYVLPLNVGLLSFVDAGRVWSDERRSCDPVGVACDLPTFNAATFNGGGLQLGYGGGLWIEVIDQALINLTVGASDEGTQVTFGVGFSY